MSKKFKNLSSPKGPHVLTQVVSTVLDFLIKKVKNCMRLQKKVRLG